MSSTIIITIVTFLYNTARVGLKFADKISAFLKNAAIRKRYKQGRNAVRDGDIDELNDIFKDRKG